MRAIAALALWAAGTIQAADSPRRIVALMPSLAETIVELGRGDRLVGVPEYTALPKELATHVKVLGPYPRISAEAVHALGPGLILGDINGNDPQLVSSLRRLGHSVDLVDTRTLAGVIDGLKLVSRLVGAGENPRPMRALQEELKALDELRTHRGAAPQPKVFLQLGWTPLVTVSGHTFIGEILQRSGTVNPFATLTKAGYPKVNVEAVVAANPDIIIICPLTDEDADVARSIAFWQRFPSIAAVQHGRIKVLPRDSLTKPGFGLAHGIKALRAALSP